MCHNLNNLGNTRVPNTKFQGRQSIGSGKEYLFLGFYYIYSRRISPSVLIATSSKLQVSRIGKKSRISLYMGQVDSFTSELLALER